MLVAPSGLYLGTRARFGGGRAGEIAAAHGQRPRRQDRFVSGPRRSRQPRPAQLDRCQRRQFETRAVRRDARLGRRSPNSPAVASWRARCKTRSWRKRSRAARCACSATTSRRSRTRLMQSAWFATSAYLAKNAAAVRALRASDANGVSLLQRASGADRRPARVVHQDGSGHDRRRCRARSSRPRSIPR